MTSFSFRPTNLLLLITLFSLAFISSASAQSKTFEVGRFDKVMVSPHIEVTFKIGEKESVIVESSTEPIEKFNVEIKNNTLQLFLTDAKVTTKSEKEANDQRVPIYKGTVIKATVIYKSVKTFSLRGEERFVFESLMDTKTIDLNIYGESQVMLKNVNLEELKATIYGNSFLKIENGLVDFQKITAYGESSVNLLDVSAKRTKLTAYGDGSFQFNTSDELKVTSYGEPTITYKGDAKVSTGLSFGEVSIVKIN